MPSIRHQQPLDFLRREHDRQAFRSLRRFNVIQPRQLGLQHLLVEEKQGALRLVLSRCRNTPRDRKVSEERLDLVRPHFTRVPLVVKEDEASHPAAIGLLRAYAIVLESDAVTELIEQPPWRWRSWEGIDAIAGNFSGRVHGAPHCFA